MEEVLNDLGVLPHGRGLINDEINASACHGQLGERVGARLGWFNLNAGGTLLIVFCFF